MSQEQLKILEVLVKSLPFSTKMEICKHSGLASFLLAAILNTATVPQREVK